MKYAEDSIRLRSRRRKRMRGRTTSTLVVLVSLTAFFLDVSSSLSLQAPAASRTTPASRSSGNLQATSTQPSHSISRVQEFQMIKRNVVQFLSNNEYDGAKEMIRAMMEYLQEADGVSLDEQLSQVVDDTFQVFFNRAFAPPYRGRGASSRVSLGASLIQLQYSSESLCSPYNQIPKSTLMSGLKALTGVRESSQTTHDLRSANAAYRVLQRLVTGVGVRHMGKGAKLKLHESDFNRVLNAYSINGDMAMAHRVVALQERTAHAPSLSAVAYSILLKGYGRLRDIDSIEMLMNRANVCGVEADIVMLNSLIDAYVNCNELDTARRVFDALRDPKMRDQLDSGHQQLLHMEDCPLPNQRTYNIVLKGFAKNGQLQDALSLTEEIRARDFWDHVTTNTLVQAAVKARDYEYAEQLLEKYTDVPAAKIKGKHKNAEAYTSLIDAYAKDGDVNKAAEVLKIMSRRNLEPNEFAHTPVIGALGRKGRVEKARMMMAYMRHNGLKVKTVTYNALISGLVHKRNDLSQNELHGNIDNSLQLLKEMMDQGVRPNANTLSVILGAFGKCEEPRVAEAMALVEKLDADNVISRGNLKIATSIVQLHGVDGNLRAALKAFEEIKNPDVAAINALLHACALCNNDSIARKTFKYYFSEQNRRQVPDVVSFSSMITCLLKKNSVNGTLAAQKLYENMKFKRRINPDNALIDIILMALVESSRTRSIHAQEVRFIAGVLRDAEKMEWAEGQLEKRKTSIDVIMTGRIADAWAEEANLYGLNHPTHGDDVLFKEHGWNKVDSGFQLWGKRHHVEDSDDVFLRSKGWNTVESGFRIF